MDATIGYFAILRHETYGTYTQNLSLPSGCTSLDIHVSRGLNMGGGTLIKKSDTCVRKNGGHTGT